MEIRTDLALEAREMAGHNINGVNQIVKNFNGMRVTKIEVDTLSASHKLGKEQGNYITVELPYLAEDFSGTDERIEIIGKYIRELLPADGLVLVVGLGNVGITPDALGPKSADRVLATRHITGDIAKQTGLDRLRSTAVISPGVLGQTGVETGEIVLSVVERIKPKAMIVIDALASRRLERLGCTLQISDTGIAPGAGVGNRRFEINKKTAGIPVIAIGIPTVVDAVTLVRDIISESSGDDTISFKEISDKEKMMVVTPREIDVLIERGSQLVGMAINSALHSCFSLEELSLLTT